MGLLIGIALGLLYGWVFHPVEQEVITPNSLQDKLKTDVILMVAEAYTSDEDPDRIHQRLEILGFDNHQAVVENALNYAKAHDFSDRDVQFLQHLHELLSSTAPGHEGSSQ
jgi:hypothetical protein